ncbi:MAG: hypothetical protein JWL82_376 [Parcubacteria group bacterium]|nr:hypothetical protein [Parcubacteria group bacterium]
MAVAVAPFVEPKLLRSLYDLDFTPILFTSRRQMVRHLKARGKSLGKWFKVAWLEYEDHDSILAFHPETGDVLRFIRTITFYITREHDEQHLKRAEVLHESIEWPDGTVTKREYNNTLSEKWNWDEIRIRDAQKRALEEELGKTLGRKYLTSPWLHRIRTGISYFKDPETGVGKGFAMAVKRDDPKRPGIDVTYNRLFHYTLKLHPDNWEEEYREEKRDKRTGKLIKTMIHGWRSTNRLDYH